MDDMKPLPSPNKPKLNPEDYYLSPEGYIIFTEAYHLKRGKCCQSGCKHCPYGFNKPNKNTRV